MMSAKNLRDSILQMAVEGKLVEQREEEGTAADLLASIREQRAQLVREKKAKPVKGGESVIWRDDEGHWFERRGKGEAVCIDDEIPFDIPDSWCWARLVSVSSVVTDGDHQAPPQVGEGVPFLVISNISDGLLSFENTRFVPKKYYDNLDNTKKPMIGDILLTVTGSFGIAVVVNTDTAFCFQRHIALIRALLSYAYLKKVLDSGYAYRYFETYATGTAQKTVSLNTLRDFLIPIPPCLEQSRIVAKLDELMPHIDEYGKAHERREQLDCELPIKLRKSILQAAVEGKLIEQSDDDEPASLLLAGIREKRAQLVREGKVKPVKGGESIIYRDDVGHWFERRGKSDPVCIDEEIPFDIPDSWCWARIESISNFGTCLNIEYNDVAEGTWNLDLEDIKKDSGIVLRKKCKCNDEQASTKHIFAEGMVLYSKLRPYLNKVIVADENGVCSSEILPIQFEGLDARYAQVFLMSPCFLSFANAHVSGTKMPRLRVADGKQCLIPVPPLAEQECIVEKVNAVLGFVDAIN